MYDMQKSLSRSLKSGALLVTALALLPGCDFLKKTPCPTCRPDSAAASAKPEDVLLTIDGTPAITKQQFEDFYEVASANAGPYGAPSEKDAFDTLVKMEILNRKIIQDGKDQTPEYRRDFGRAYDLARWGVNSQQLAKELQDKIDTSDAAVEKFYNEQKGNNQAFDRPPFLKNAESVTLQSVQFSDKAAADKFLAKAKSDFAGSAKAANLTIKDHGKVSAQSQNVDFALRLKAKSMAPNSVELVQSGDKYFVAKAGSKSAASYADYKELAAMPQMKDMLGQFKKQVELESAFIKQIDEYKKGFTIVENLKYFDEKDAQRKVEEEQYKELIAQKLKEQGDKAPAKPAGVVAA